jgi:uncharacterized membrane protein
MTTEALLAGQARPVIATDLAPAVRRITIADIRAALASGYEDFKDSRVYLIVLALIYPLLGLVLGRAAAGDSTLPLIYPLLAGFALIGPFASVGLYEMSKRREQGLPIAWGNAFDILRSPRLAAIILLGVVQGGIFVAWIVAAHLIFRLTLQGDAPMGMGALMHAVMTTSAGWALLIVGNAVGFVFAVIALTIGVVSFPLLVDRAAGADIATQVSVAVRTSARAVMANPVPLAVWGLVVAGGLVVGSIPLLVGLAVVMPVLGHATWHLYRKLVV